jgi:DNA-binding response OmpR family regulator
MVNYKLLSEQTKTLSLLIVEDYAPLRNELEEVMEDFFDKVIATSNGAEALTHYYDYYQIHKKGFDLVISDIQMPSMNGIELVKSLRKIDRNQQIIILSAHTDKEYLLELINLGVSQFIVKPIDYDELLIMLSTVIANKPLIQNEYYPNDEKLSIVHLGDGYDWDKDNLLLTKDGNSVELTRHELYLLRLLVNSGHIICNDDIIQDFYSNGIDISENSIRNLVFKLRKKLPANIISSVYGMGYKLSIIKD